jgi:hypothetical protein
MRKTIISVFLLFVSFTVSYSQQKIYCSFDASLPTFALSGDKISQQLNISLGYSPIEQLAVFYNFGSGLLGEKKTLTHLHQLFENGIGIDWDVFSIGEYTLGLNASGGYAVDFNSEENTNNHAVFRSGIKLTMPSNIFLVAGINNRFYQRNTTELLISIGYRIN